MQDSLPKPSSASVDTVATRSKLVLLSVEDGPAAVLEVEAVQELPDDPTLSVSRLLPLL